MIGAVLRMGLVAGVLVAASGCQGPLQVGAIAPDFSGVTDDGKTFASAGLKGKRGVIVCFYQQDGATGSIVKTCAFRDRFDQLDEKGYTVVGINCDSMETHRAFKAKYALPFGLIADTDGAIARRFGVALEHKALAGKPTLPAGGETFVVDKDGKIIAHVKVEDPDDHVRDALRAVGVPY